MSEELAEETANQQDFNESPLHRDFCLLADFPPVLWNRIARVLQPCEDDKDKVQFSEKLDNLSIKHPLLRQAIQSLERDFSNRRPSETLKLAPPTAQLDEGMNLTKLAAQAIPVVTTETIAYLFLADKIKLLEATASNGENYNEHQIKGINRQQNDDHKLSVSAPELQVAQIITLDPIMEKDDAEPRDRKYLELVFMNLAEFDGKRPSEVPSPVKEAS